MSETNLLQSIRLACSRGAVRLWRNNTGKLEDKTGRWVSFGLCEGSSDLIGLKSVVITPEMVGQRVAIFTAIECKAKRGRLSVAQATFLAAVRTAGGIAIEARSVEDCEAALLGGPSVDKRAF